MPGTARIRMCDFAQHVIALANARHRLIHSVDATEDLQGFRHVRPHPWSQLTYGRESHSTSAAIIFADRRVLPLVFTQAPRFRPFRAQGRQQRNRPVRARRRPCAPILPSARSMPRACRGVGKVLWTKHTQGGSIDRPRQAFSQNVCPQSCLFHVVVE